MIRARICGSVAAALLATACVNITPKDPPGVAGNAVRPYLAQRLPTDGEKAATYGVDDSHFGVTVRPGAGNVVTGLLLLGPLGAGLNMVALRSEAANHAAALKDVTALDVAILLREGAPDLAVMDNASGSARRLELVPSVTMVFTDSETFHLACTIHAALVENSSATWRLKYTAELEGNYKLSPAPEAAAMKGEVRGCVTRAYALYRSHMAGELAAWRSYEIETADGLLPGTSTLTLPVHEPDLPTRIVANDGFSVREMRRSAVFKLTPR
jgi:hypothetical protein